MDSVDDRYSEALEDLEKARDLEVAAFGYSSGLVLLPMGNAKGALGDWEVRSIPDGFHFSDLLLYKFSYTGHA